MMGRYKKKKFMFSKKNSEGKMEINILRLPQQKPCILCKTKRNQKNLLVHNL